MGAHRRVMVCSVTEGEDKPLKYPVMFRSVDAVLVNKTDLLPHLDLDVDLLERNIRAVNPSTQILRMSARTGAGLDAWYAWLTGALVGLSSTRLGRLLLREGPAAHDRLLDRAASRCR